MAEEVMIIFKDYKDSLRETLNLAGETDSFFYSGCIVSSMISIGVWDLRDYNICKCCHWNMYNNDNSKGPYRGCCRPSANGAI